MKKIKTKKIVNEQRKKQYEFLNSKLADFWNNPRIMAVPGEVGKMRT